MYDNFFGFKRRPFSATPDPGCFFPAASARKALGELEDCVRSGQGIGVLTAPAGMGKTLLGRRLTVTLSREFTTLFVPHSNFPTRRSLLQAMLYEFGLPYAKMSEQELRLELTTACKRACQATSGAVVVIDEAHLLNERLLEELRTITNLADKGQPLVRLVLCGQLPLEEKLASPELAALNQRVACQAALESLTRAESVEYIVHRLRLARTPVDAVFTAEAIDAICQASDGLPRCLNHLCDHSLAISYAANGKPVTAAVVLAALEDLRQLPLHWNDPLPALSPVEQLNRDVQAQRGSSRVATPAPTRPQETVEMSSACFEIGADIESIESQIAEANCVEVGFDPSPREAKPALPPVDVSPSTPVQASSPPAKPIQRRPQRSKGPSNSGPLVEELIVDRYAWLDAGWTLPPAPAPASAARASGEVAVVNFETGHDGDCQLEDEISAAVMDVWRDTRAAVSPRPSRPRAVASPAEDSSAEIVSSQAAEVTTHRPTAGQETSSHAVHEPHALGPAPHLKFSQLFSKMRRSRENA